jgi:LuxR family maltose regulon positive regulatory protein
MPVVATKLYAPALRGPAVPRARLQRGMDALLEPGQRLGLVSAPAGFGKTTLVGTWASAAARESGGSLSVAWVSLDAADSDLGRLMAHLFTALLRAGVPVDPQALSSGALNVRAATALLTTVVNRLADLGSGTGPGMDSGDQKPGRRWLLVLDDYHAVTGPEVHEVIAYLLDHLPEQLRLVISTRSDPPLPLARLRSRGQSTEVRAADLRFTDEEADAFLNQVMGLSLESSDVEALDERTEGWAAGLQMAGLSLRGRATASDVAAFIKAFTGSNRFIVDYLADEVLAEQPEGIRDFLLRTSVLTEKIVGRLIPGWCAGTIEECGRTAAASSTTKRWRRRGCGRPSR